MSKEFSILINTTDSFSDCWGPFFHLFCEYWPNYDGKIYLNTENKTFSYQNLNIISVQNGLKNGTWSECLEHAVNKIDEEYFIYLQEDYFFNNLVNHEDGVDDKQTSISSPSAITAFVESAEFDLDDGHKFSFVYRLVPDITFDGSTADSPVATFTLNPLSGSGSGINSPASEGGSNAGTVTRSATSPVEAYTDQVYTRVRGRQMSVKIQSTATGTTWQVGTPRIDLRPDGRR